MSTNYLRSFIESVADVPTELDRWFRGMRELDEKAHTLQIQLEIDCQAQLRATAELAAATGPPTSKKPKVEPDAASPGPAGVPALASATPTPPQAPGTESNELAQRIDNTTAELLKLSTEKTNIAQQIYDYVDQHIRRLDKDLRAFDAELAVERSKLGLPPEPTAGAAVPVEGGRRNKNKNAPPPEVKPPTSEELYQAALAAADASEPTYCYCKRISFGEMIACEHPDCPIEWFHFECVGLTPETRPKGKWYCKDCRKLLGKK